MGRKPTRVVSSLFLMTDEGNGLDVVAVVVVVVDEEEEEMDDIMAVEFVSIFDEIEKELVPPIE